MNMHAVQTSSHIGMGLTTTNNNNNLSSNNNNGDDKKSLNKDLRKRELLRVTLENYVGYYFIVKTVCRNF